MDIDDIILRVKNGEEITLSDIDNVCRVSMEILQKEENVIYIQSPINVCGDVHGDFDNLLSIFDIFGDAPESRYLFLGDYVDRGDKSVPTAIYLLALKIKYPNDFYLIRGNHETMETTITFGFYNEIMKKYANFSVWQSFMEVFKCLPIAAVIDNKLFCVHGGLSSRFTEISQLQQANRFNPLPTPQTGVIHDVLWSDPYDGKGYQESPRSAGCLWGIDVSRKFVQKNNLTMIVRGHELKKGGYAIAHDNLVVTVFSTPFYVSQYSEAAVLEVVSPTERHITRFRPHQWEDNIMKMMFSNPWNQ